MYRGLTDYREIKIEQGIIEKAEGSARVLLGKTEVLVGTKVETGEPFPDTPNEGVMTVNAELVPSSALSSQVHQMKILLSLQELLIAAYANQRQSIPKSFALKQVRKYSLSSSTSTYLTTTETSLMLQQ